MNIALTTLWFVGTLCLKIIGKMMPLFFHELYILAEWMFNTTRSATVAVANDPNVQSTVRAVGVKLEDEAIIIYKRLGTRERIALVVAPFLFVVLIASAIHLYHG